MLGLTRENVLTRYYRIVGEFNGKNDENEPKNEGASSFEQRYEQVRQVIQLLLGESLKRNTEAVYGASDTLDQQVQELIDIGVLRGRAEWERYFNEDIPAFVRERSYILTVEYLAERKNTNLSSLPIPVAELDSILRYVQDVTMAYLMVYTEQNNT